MVFHLDFAIEINIECAERPDNLHLLPGLVIDKKPREWLLGDTVHIDGAEKGEVHDPVVAFLVAVVDELEHLRPQQLVVPVHQHHDILGLAVVESSIHNIIGRVVPLQVLDEGDALLWETNIIDQFNSLLQSGVL